MNFFDVMEVIIDEQHQMEVKMGKFLAGKRINARMNHKKAVQYKAINTARVSLQNGFITNDQFFERIMLLNHPPELVGEN